MSKWIEYRLGDNCSKIGSGATPRGGGDTYLKESEYILVRSQNVLDFTFSYNGLAYISKEQADNLRNVAVFERDILLNITGDSIARVCQIPKELIHARVNQHVAIIRPNSKTLNPEYVKYYLLNPSFKEYLLMLGSSGATRNALTKAIIEDFTIQAPPIDEQCSIAEILSSLDDKIELNNAINKNLEDLTQALFKQWFVDFEFPNANGEPYKFTGGEMVESELGKIPKGWSLSRIKNLNPILETGRRPLGGVKGIEEGMPSVGAESIKGIGYFDYSKTKYVSFDYAKLMNRGIINGFELLIYKDGGKPGTFIPHFSMFGNGFPFNKMVINEHVFSLNFNNNLNFNVFCYFYFNTPYVVSLLENSGGKAAIPGINQSDINNLLVFQPENDLVKLFGEIAFDNVSTILQNCKENHMLSKLRDTILPKLISGELEVNEAFSQTEKAMLCHQ